MKLEVGKLYCVREAPLLVYPTEVAAYVGRDHYEGVYIDTSQPFLVLNVRINPRRDVRDTRKDDPYNTYEVLYNDRKGWIWIDVNNPVKEIV